MDRWQSEQVRRAFVPVVVYVAAAVLITWPLATRLWSHAAGTGYSDTYEVVRHIWWAGEALKAGHNPFDQPLLAYPDGFMSWVQWTHPLQYLPAALLAFGTGPLAAFNLVLLLTLVGNGLAAYRLGLALNGGRRAGALLGGLAFLAYPAVQGHLSVGHLGLVTLWPLALFATTWRRILRGEGSLRDALWGGLWFALTALAYVSHLVFVLVPFVVLYTAALGFVRRGDLWRGDSWRDRPLFRAGLALVVGGLLIAPFYLPLITAEGQGELGDVSETGRVTFSTDVLAFVTPSPFGPLDAIGRVPDVARDVLGTNSAEGTAYVGVVAGLLLLVAVITRREARAWLVVALGAAILALGPLLKWRDAPLRVEVDTFQSYVTLPWLLFLKLPVIEATRTPGRFNLLVGLAMSGLVSLGAAWLLGRVRRAGVRVALVVALAAVMLAEYQLFSPFPTVAAQMPPYFDQLAAEPDVRAVLDVPTGDLLVAKIALYQQTFHHQPLIAGHALRRTPQNPALLAVLDRAVLGDFGDGLPSVRDAEVPALLAAAGADRVIVHKDFVSDPVAVVRRLRGILGPPEFEDGRIAVFAVPRAAESSPPVVWAASALGWAGPVALGSGGASLLEDEAAWFLATPETYGEVVFDAAGFGQPRRIAVRLDGALVGGFVAGDGMVRLPLWIEAGYHTLSFTALGGCDPYPFELACLTEEPFGASCVRQNPPYCLSAAFGVPQWIPSEPEPEAVDVALEQGVRLRAQAITVGEDAVTVRLFWVAPHALSRSYALFVHVADPDSGQPLAQDDGFPLVPTDRWTEGATWVSDVTVRLPPDLPPGEYAVNVGWFDPQTGERLGVRGDGRWAVDGIVHLGNVRIQ